jgi:hypothetical protein
MSNRLRKPMEHAGPIQNYSTRISNQGVRLVIRYTSNRVLLFTRQSADLSVCVTGRERTLPVSKMDSENTQSSTASEYKRPDLQR